jgi:hypothetical protein
MSFENYVKSMTSAVDVASKGGKDMFVSVISFFSLFCAPLSPAIMFGYALYSYVSIRMGHNAGLWSGIALAVALEGVGLVSAYVALASYHEWDEGRSGPEKMIAAVGIAVLYIIVGITAIVLFDTDFRFRVVGILAFVIAALLYAANAIQSGDKHRTDRTKQDKHDNLELRKYQIAQKTEVEKEKIRANGQTANHHIFEQQKQAAILKRQAKREEFLQYLRDNPLAMNNVSELVRQIKASRPSVDKWIDEYKANGTIVITTSDDGQKHVEVRLKS